MSSGRKGWPLGARLEGQEICSWRWQSDGFLVGFHGVGSAVTT
jgi:hypothetical protein